MPSGLIVLTNLFFAECPNMEAAFDLETRINHNLRFKHDHLTPFTLGVEGTEQAIQGLWPFILRLILISQLILS